MEKPIIRGIIFDLDGVLVDTAKYHFRSWIRISEHLGFKLNPNLEEQLKGISRMDSLNIVLDSEGISKSEDEKLELAKMKNDWYLQSLEDLNDSVVLPGVKEFLNELSEMGIAMAVGSASKNATRILHKLDMASYFVSIVDGNLVEQTKPHPEVFLNAARDLQLPENECLVFEDSQKGLIAAKAGGFYSVGIGDEEVLKEADLVISGFDGRRFAEILTNMGKDLVYHSK